MSASNSALWSIEKKYFSVKLILIKIQGRYFIGCSFTTISPNATKRKRKEEIEFLLHCSLNCFLEGAGYDNSNEHLKGQGEGRGEMQEVDFKNVYSYVMLMFIIIISNGRPFDSCQIIVIAKH